MDPCDSQFELPLVCQVLDITLEQVERMCRALGIVPSHRDGETCLERESVQRLYGFLYPPYVPPEPTT